MKRAPIAGEKLLCIGRLDDRTARVLIGSVYTAYHHPGSRYSSHRGFIDGVDLVETHGACHPRQDFISLPDEIDRRK